MKHLAYVCALALLAMPGCKKKDKDGGGGEEAKPAEGAGDVAAEPAAQVELSDVDLSPAGIAATMKAPAGAKVEESFGSAKITADGFGVEISTGKPDMAGQKKFWTENTANKLKKWVVDEPNVLLAETEVMGKTEHHLVVSVDGGEEGFDCQNVKGTSWTLAQAKTMVEACKSIAPAPAGDDGEAEGEAADGDDAEGSEGKTE